ncbi:arylamine N-acetyltransferase family protein [Actinomadura parmotrematis]|uniref:Arylamine N-acetyltransferase n=1 Tax=Actinomadura parmotrematis TaxID=2864039 RepID=A0ABS7G0L0_9ACTN|nr:arylamine N-acetyltransferase [Actinomadura parmotrematis]MBW8486212.1 arylamine N-acetyltransferase [Actinomadura parmotrematis]
MAFDVAAYLAALGHRGPAAPTLATLRALHHRHLRTFAYDSALNAGRGTALWAGVDIDRDAAFDEIVLGGRGGVCYELNGLFRLLLHELGFDVGVFGAGIRQMDGGFGPDLEHVFNHARLDGDLYLVDVGFVGPSYLEPLRVTEQVQEQHGSRFRVVPVDGYHVVERSGRSGVWQAVYRYRDRPRDLAEWQAPSPELEAFARALAGAGILVRGRSTATGQRVLIGKRLLTVDDGRETVRVLTDPAEHERVVADITGAPAATGGTR